MSKKKLLITNIVLFAILFLAISVNKDYLRPMFSHQLPGMIITGCLPNFLAAFIISLMMLNALMIKLAKYRHMLLYLIPALIFVILAFEEFVPLWGASSKFDIYDIIASGIGAILSPLAYKLIHKKLTIP